MNDHFLKFQECESCAVKPGSPVLCKSCINNRTLIEILYSKIQGDETKDMIESFTVKMKSGSWTYDLGSIVTKPVDIIIKSGRHRLAKLRVPLKWKKTL